MPASPIYGQAWIHVHSSLSSQGAHAILQQRCVNLNPYLRKKFQQVKFAHSWNINPTAWGKIPTALIGCCGHVTWAQNSDFGWANIT